MRGREAQPAQPWAPEVPTPRAFPTGTASGGRPAVSGERGSDPGRGGSGAGAPPGGVRDGGRGTPGCWRPGGAGQPGVLELCSAGREGVRTEGAGPGGSVPPRERVATPPAAPPGSPGRTLQRARVPRPRPGVAQGGSRRASPARAALSPFGLSPRSLAGQSAPPLPPVSGPGQERERLPEVRGRRLQDLPPLSLWAHSPLN